MEKKSNYKLFASMIVFASFFMCIGYAALNSVTLSLNGLANVLSPKKLFIADVITSENNSFTTVNLYDETFLDTKIKLNDKDSTATLSITIKNNSRYDYSFVGIDYMIGSNTYDNQNIIFNLVGLKQDDIITSTNSLTFDLVFSYSDKENITNNILNSKLSFKFKNISGIQLSELILLNEQEPTSGEDGLYQFQDKYYYSGENVNNYIWYNCKENYNSGIENCEIWRILDIEADGNVKIIKDSVLEQEVIARLEADSEVGFWLEHINEVDKVSNMIASGKTRFDPRRRRPIGNLETGTSYCIYSSNGCNAFASNLTSGSYSNLIVDGDSTIKTYLEEIYYEKVLTDSAKRSLQINEYNIGIIDINIGKKIDSLYALESSIKCNSKVALLNLSNYVLASKDSSCRTNFLGSGCANNNWLRQDLQYMFLNGKVTATNAQIFIHDTTGMVTSRDANQDLYLRPVITLKTSLIATGTGTSDDYYVIVE